MHGIDKLFLNELFMNLKSYGILDQFINEFNFIFDL